MSAQTLPVMEEPIHLLLLRGVVYASALLMATWTVAGLGVNIAVVAAALAAVFAGRQLAATSLRTWVVAAASCGVILFGWILGSALGSATWFAHLTGPSKALAITQAVTFGLGAFGLVTLFRVLALRWRVLAILEVIAGAAVVIGLFAGHRDFQIAQPRFLADWAFSTGRDPFLVLMTIGLGTLAALVLLLLPRQRLRRNIAAVLGVFLLVGAFSLLGPATSQTPDDASGSSGGFNPNDDKLNFEDRKQPDSDKKEPVALVMFRDSLTPLYGQYHFRMQAYSQLTNNRLGLSTLAGTNVDVPTAFPGGQTPVAGSVLPSHLGTEITTSVAMISKHQVPAALVTPTAMFPEVNPDPKYFVQVYGVRSRAMSNEQRKPLETALFAAAAGDPAWSEAVRNHYLEVPNDPRYKELADRLVAEERKARRLPATYNMTPFYRGVVFLTWVRENTTYNLSPGNSGSPDPAADFLFGSHKGFCVHVASSMAFLLRTQGIPARVAGGYAAGLDRRGQGSSLLLQKSDAHAWCEIYLQGIGWVPLDGSPKKSDERMPPPPSPETKSFLQNRFEDKTNESRTAELPKDETPSPSHLFGLLWLGAIPGLLALVMILYSVKVWRWQAPRFASARALHRVAYRAALDRLAEAGFVRHFGETREQFAERMAAIVPELPDVTADHLRGAMGGDATSGGQWLELQSKICQRLAGHVSRTRWYLGLANPVSWVLVR